MLHEQNNRTACGETVRLYVLLRVELPAAALASSSVSSISLVSSVFSLRARLCYLESSSLYFLPVELIDRGQGCGVIGHLDECKALGATCHTICDQVYRQDFPDRSEEFRQGSIGGRVAQVAHV
jgi:hypothetical protein